MCSIATAESRAKIWPLIAFKAPVASTVVCSKAVVVLFLIHRLLLLPLFVRVCVWGGVYFVHVIMQHLESFLPLQ